MPTKHYYHDFTTEARHYGTWWIIKHMYLHFLISQLLTQTTCIPIQFADLLRKVSYKRIKLRIRHFALQADTMTENSHKISTCAALREHICQLSRRCQAEKLRAWANSAPSVSVKQRKTNAKIGQHDNLKGKTNLFGMFVKQKQKMLR